VQNHYFMTRRKGADEADKSMRTIDRAIASGEFDPIKLDHSVLIVRPSFDRWLAVRGR